MPWEYRVDKIKTSGVVVPNIDSLTDEDLNGRGRDNWELISCIPMNRGGGILEAVYLIFKRPVPTDYSRLSYRKRVIGQDYWHCCTNCSEWPKSGYVQVGHAPAAAESVCPECLDKQEMGECSPLP